MIGICTDSNAQLPRELIDRFDLEVVPIIVTVDGVEYSEGVDLDADQFYARYAAGRTPTVATSQPSPGRFTQAYERLAARGAREVISIHVAESLSGTLNAARLGATSSPAKVHLVDSGTASFGVGCCVWEAADALQSGSTVREAIDVAKSLGRTIGNVFIVQALEPTRAGGRIKLDFAPPGVPILSLIDGEVKVVAHATTVEESVEAMADYVKAWGTALKVAVGIADTATKPWADRLGRMLDDAVETREVITYRIGPSVGTHTGPGCVGAFFFQTAGR